jgi:two-component sensor histidine kinase
MENKYIKSIIKNHDKKENFLIGTYIGFLFVLVISIITNYKIDNTQLVYYESIIAFLTFASFVNYLYRRAFLFSVYTLVFFATILSYILLIEVKYKLALFHVIVPLNYFFLFSLRRALIFTAIHEFIVSLIYIYAYVQFDGIEEVLYEGNILSIIIASLVIMFFGVLYHLVIERSYDALERANYQKEILLNEIHHRVSNNLQMISAMLGLQKSTYKDQKLDKIVDKSILRIQSIAMVHQSLYGQNDFENITFETYIRKLADNVTNLNDKEIQVNIDGNNISLPTADILKIGIITNELLINSIKHAFENQDAKVYISLNKDHNSLIYKYKDNGKKEIDINTDNTLGYKIITMMVDQIGAELLLTTDNGFDFKLVIPN